MQVTSIAQLTVLQLVGQAGSEEWPLCLLNTHLFFHPNAPHIRTLHVAAMLAEAHALAESVAAELGQTPALLFCGDFNSDMNDGMPGEAAAFLRVYCRHLCGVDFVWPEVRCSDFPQSW